MKPKLTFHRANNCSLLKKINNAWHTLKLEPISFNNGPVTIDLKKEPVSNEKLTKKPTALAEEFEAGTETVGPENGELRAWKGTQPSSPNKRLTMPIHLTLAQPNNQRKLSMTLLWKRYNLSRRGSSLLLLSPLLLNLKADSRI